MEAQLAISEDPDASLSARLQRIWAERGDFSKVTHASLDQPAVNEEDVEKADDDQITQDELWKLKSEMLGKLECVLELNVVCWTDGCRTARGELTTALDLLNLVLPEVVQTKPDDPPPPEVPLPHGTLSSTVLDVPLAQRPLAKRSHEAAIALASKRVSLQSISDRLVAASDQLATTATSAERTWRKWLDWADEGRVEARGSRNGAGMRDPRGLERTAKDVVTFFGFEEASRAFRQSSYAGVDEQGDLVVPPRARGRRRLVITLRLSGDGVLLTASPSMGEESEIDQARRGIFDEELYAEVRSARLA